MTRYFCYRGLEQLTAAMRSSSNSGVSIAGVGRAYSPPKAGATGLARLLLED
ncbi:MAG TPA: hypothetical protein VGP18_11555 [Solirubrobacteraceae bacterium]|nr:hypothetical protein [Solirubrobacteraceae bacterium]